MNSQLIGPANGTLTTPFKIIPSNVGTYYLSDQMRNAVFEYSMDGVLLRTVLGNLTQARGIALHENQIYVAVGDNANNLSTQNTIQRFNLDGSPAGVETLPGGGTSPVFARFTVQEARFSSPWDITVQGARLLVSNFQNSGAGNPVTPDVFEVDLATGASSSLVQDTFGLSGAQQIIAIEDGGFAVAAFSNTFSLGLPLNTAGIYLFNADGSQRLYYNLAFGPRGIAQLANGNWLFSTANGIRSFDPISGDPAAPLVPGTENGQFRMITPAFAMTRPVIPEPGFLALPLAAGVALMRRARRAKVGVT